METMQKTRMLSHYILQKQQIVLCDFQRSQNVGDSLH